MRSKICIAISDPTDVTTSHILEYIKHLDRHEVIRVNSTDEISINVELGVSKVLTLYVRDKIISVDDIDSILYRSGDINHVKSFDVDRFSLGLGAHILEYLNREWAQVKEYLFRAIYRGGVCVSIGNPLREKHNNRIFNAEVAMSLGIKVPHTLITTLKVELQNFIRNDKRYITKNITYPLSFTLEDISYCSRPVTLVDASSIQSMANEFTVSLFQEYIAKLFEVRVFYLRGSFFSMAIFSQNDEQTKLDFRDYNKTKPNRMVPYQLPPEIEEKLNKLMGILHLDTGSIDLIYSIDKHYYFLEVNPHGQFGWLSHNCNYYIEKSIASLLSNGKTAS